MTECDNCCGKELFNEGYVAEEIWMEDTDMEAEERRNCFVVEQLMFCSIKCGKKWFEKHLKFVKEELP